MCVILYAEDKRPSEEMVKRAWRTNSHGGGAAWREPAEDGDGIEVVWKKGLSEAEMIKLAAELPMPYVLHFRITSTGPNIPELTHPFPIDDAAPNFMSGRIKGQVLFHNGTWSGWRNSTLDTLLKLNRKLPRGKLSDTRAMALMVSIYGPGFMDLIDEKGIIFGRTNEETEMFWGTGWHEVDGIWASNLSAKAASYYTSEPASWKPTGGGAYGGGRRNFWICQSGSCRERDNLDDKGFCPKCRSNNKDNKVVSTPSQLPASTNRGPETVQTQAKSQVLAGTPTPNAVASAESSTIKAEVVGGPQQETPFPEVKNFVEAKRLFEAGKISKSAFKRARNLYQKRIKKEGRIPMGVTIRGRKVTLTPVH